jgi:uncharacterized protein YcfJ
MNRHVTPFFIVALALACASAPKPILYPNPHLEEVGKAKAKTEIEECRGLADEAGAHRDPGKVTGVAASTAKGAAVGGAAGAASGAVVGNAGRGAAMGATGAAAGAAVGAMLRKPKVSQAHVNFVNRCLKERGYEPIGWD